MTNTLEGLKSVSVLPYNPKMVGLIFERSITEKQLENYLTNLKTIFNQAEIGTNSYGLKNQIILRTTPIENDSRRGVHNALTRLQRDGFDFNDVIEKYLDSLDKSSEPKGPSF